MQDRFWREELRFAVRYTQNYNLKHDAYMLMKDSQFTKPFIFYFFTNLIYTEGNNADAFGNNKARYTL